jgi:hypothetical protein
MGCNFAELKATTTTRARAPSDWLIGELFSYTELRRNLRLALFPAKRLQNYRVLLTFFSNYKITRTLQTTFHTVMWTASQCPNRSMIENFAPEGESYRRPPKIG